MPYSNSNPVVAAILRRRSCPLPPLQVANAFRTTPGPQVADETLADDVNAAWLPTIPGQAVPMLGEVRYDDDDPSLNE